jgi:hypothetical protein
MLTASASEMARARRPDAPMSAVQITTEERISKPLRDY